MAPREPLVTYRPWEMMDVLRGTGLETDVLVVGGGLGGVAAALAVARSGRRAVVTEPTDWLGGQLTSQAVPPDEHPWIERTGRTVSYAALRAGIRRYYRTWYPLAAVSARNRYLNPGRGWVSRLCHEPRVAVAVIDGLLAPHELAGRITVLRNASPVTVDVERDRVRSVTFAPIGAAASITIDARYVLDASETGELLPLAGVEHVSGAEGRDQTGEPHAAPVADPLNMQAFTHCMAIEHAAGEDHTIDRPRDYDRWRRYSPPGWPGPLFSWTAPNPQTLDPVTYPFLVDADEPAGEGSVASAPGRGSRNLWTYRRIAARATFVPGTLEREVTIVNWPQTDYAAGPLLGEDADRISANLQSARDLSLGFLYWLQTEAPRPDGGAGWPGLRLRPDVTGTADGLAMAPYVREARRIRALYTLSEFDVAADQRSAGRIDDSIGVGYYRIDLHPSTGGDPYIDIPSRPFEIPLRSLIPIRVENVLAAGKAVGCTHVANGCVRMHPTEWNIGEVAGLLSAFCLERGATPRAVATGARRRDEFLQRADAAGIQRHWPTGVSAG